MSVSDSFKFTPHSQSIESSNSIKIRPIGLVGGISWVSTIDYYRYINEGINKKLGGNEFAECMIYSLNYGEVIRLNMAKDFAGIKATLLNACLHLRNSGAKGIVLCANTMHMFIPELEKKLDIPFIHIASATADAVLGHNLKKIGLLGTLPTMELDFYKDKLNEKGIEVLIPDDADRNFVHQKIFSELGKGIVLPETRSEYINIMTKLIENGAEGIILGCTEIPLLIKQADVAFPVFDTTLIHAEAAVSFSLAV